MLTWWWGQGQGTEWPLDLLCSPPVVYTARRTLTSPPPIGSPRRASLEPSCTLPFQVPVVAIMATGGGVRAMTSLYGQLTGLRELGLLDCVSYITGASGSTWTLANLYKDPEWSQKDLGSATELLKTQVTKNKLGVLAPSQLQWYYQELEERARLGHPACFTNLWALINEAMRHDGVQKGGPRGRAWTWRQPCWVAGRGEISRDQVAMGLHGGISLQPDDHKLSGQRQALRHGQNPLPIYCALNTKGHGLSTFEFGGRSRQLVEAPGGQGLGKGWLGWCGEAVFHARLLILWSGTRVNPDTHDPRVTWTGGESPRPLWLPCVGSGGQEGGGQQRSLPAAEWCEFSPYEVGFPKYGAFIPSELFGSEFFMGRLMKRMPESRICFLEGIWTNLYAASLQDSLYWSSEPSQFWDRWAQTLTSLDKEQVPVLKMEEPPSLAGRIGELFSGLLTRRPLAQATHNFLRGLQFHKDYFQHPHFSSWKDTKLDGLPNQLTPGEPHLCLLDVGYFVNTSCPPLLQPTRDVDLILSLDYNLNAAFQVGELMTGTRGC
ncbi:cytosolic phospholipase A2 beta-like isoform X2 [Tenrec ecaudatus]|uniref:cytosolic phospholipase A2 beta-like isoform X2 n=1 Tax=Tenrec ecaudatus TaxID=94439 RepID=UPI003F59339A